MFRLSWRWRDVDEVNFVLVSGCLKCVNASGGSFNIYFLRFCEVWCTCCGLNLPEPPSSFKRLNLRSVPDKLSGKSHCNGGKCFYWRVSVYRVTPLPRAVEFHFLVSQVSSQVSGPRTQQRICGRSWNLHGGFCVVGWCEGRECLCELIRRLGMPTISWRASPVRQKQAPECNAEAQKGAEKEIKGFMKLTNITTFKVYGWRWTGIGWVVFMFVWRTLKSQTVSFKWPGTESSGSEQNRSV